MVSTGNYPLENPRSSLSRDTKLVFPDSSQRPEFAQNKTRFLVPKDGPNTAFVSPFPKRERALSAIGITLGLIENKILLATLDCESRGPV
jgi:hypothetical protein